MPKYNVIQNKDVSNLKIKVPQIYYCSTKNCNNKFFQNIYNPKKNYNHCNKCFQKVISKKLNIIGKTENGVTLAKKICYINRNDKEKNHILRCFINHIYLKNMTRRKCACFICKNNKLLITKLDYIKKALDIVREKKLTEEISKLMIKN